jgi:hypothetical protein
MELPILLAHATKLEQAVILAEVRRIAAMPAVVVTVREGSRHRRYVVAQEDEQALRRFVGHTPEQLATDLGQMGTVLFAFGGQWLRGPGRVDELYRSLSLADVVKVEAVDRDRV